MNRPIYPIYIVSKGRFKNCLTAKFFIEDKVDFKLVVEPQEYEEYTQRFGIDRVLKLPFSNLGLGSMPARNWIWEHSRSLNAKRHWIFDDNIRLIGRLHRGKRIRCNANLAISIIEEFTDRYENIGISGFNYQMFVTNHTSKPFYQNVHIYSAMLILNEMPFRWRMRYNEDTDLCLQVLSNSLCTVLFNTFYADKMTTMAMKGGNTDELYKGDGRLKMARALEQMWPDYVQTKYRFHRAQHVVKWYKFITKLKKRLDINWKEIESRKYDIKLEKVKEIRSKSLNNFYKGYK